jgi:NAD(P)-dependent dehydrogenase (short-subunit alcohol dehydrogenase family)
MEHILVTGANRGIGLALVKQWLAVTDAHVFATARQPDAAADLHTLQRQHPDRLTLVKLEVTSAADIDAAVAAVRQQTAALDVLVNNAGIDPDDGWSLELLKPEVMLRAFEVNTVAPAMITKAFLPLLKASDRPRVVNISSDMGSIENRTYSDSHAYCASKAALNMVTRGFAVELRRDHVTLVCLDPGWVQTDMGGADAPLEPVESARGIVNVVSGLTPQDSGRYLRWDGGTHPW